MAPGTNKIGGPHAVRVLSSSVSITLKLMEDTSAIIRDTIAEGSLRETELMYARLLLAMSEAERGLKWTQEQCAVLLGETIEEGEGRG